MKRPNRINNLVEAAGIEPASEDLQHKVSTCLFRDLCLARKGPLGMGSYWANPLVISHRSQRARELNYPATGASSNPAGENRRGASLYAARAYSLLLASIFLYRRFNESPECSACNLDLNCPRRNQKSEAKRS